MTGPENHGSTRQTTGNDVQKEPNVYQDEINLIGYFRVLWKRKWFVFLGSVVPALVAGFTVFSTPRDYKISYTYNMGLDEKAFRVLESEFYSAENLEKVVEKLQAAGFDRYAKKLADTQAAENLKQFVSFEISPSYFEVIKPSKVRSLDELQEIQQARGTLLVMHVGAKSEENIRGIASVCRENFEQIIPVYSVREELNNKTINLKGKMAGIEEARYTLDLCLERKNSTLEKLKTSGSDGSERLPSDIVLQFNNVGGDSAYLPLPYQIQAAQTRIINLEEQIRANKEIYSYYAGLLKLNEKFFSHVKKVMASHYTLEQFHSFLTDVLADCKKKELLDYLKAYVKQIENKMATLMPLVERPKVHPIAKGTVKTGAIVFGVALMLSVFAAFLLEGLEKSRSPAT